MGGCFCIFNIAHHSIANKYSGLLFGLLHKTQSIKTDITLYIDITGLQGVLPLRKKTAAKIGKDAGATMIHRIYKIQNQSCCNAIFRMLDFKRSRVTGWFDLHSFRMGVML